MGCGASKPQTDTVEPSVLPEETKDVQLAEPAPDQPAATADVHSAPAKAQAGSTAKGHAEHKPESKGKSVGSDDELVVPEEPGSLPADARIIFVLGGPGSGKGTQCARIVKKYGFKHLSAGDLLRDEVKSGSRIGQKLEETMKEGRLVPSSVTITLLKNAMIRSGEHQFLVDGFPRALDQAELFEKDVKRCERVLFFDCPLETMEERLLNRGKTSGRSDDNAETIKKRFKTFQESSMPVVDHFGKRVHKISAVPPPEEVFKEVEKILDGPQRQADSEKEEESVSVANEPGSLPEDTRIIFVLGGPGSGKGTQCERIVAKYGYQHLSAGDLLRDEVKSGSQAGRGLEAIMKEGRLVPQEVTITLLRNAMIRSKKNEFLIDGFPRALDQAKTFEEQVQPCETILFFGCPLETMEERLLSRGKTSGRSDDNAETIKKRFKTFQEMSLPVIEHYEKQGKVHRISAVPPPDQVFEAVQRAFASLGPQSQAQEAATEPDMSATPVIIRGPQEGRLDMDGADQQQEKASTSHDSAAQDASEPQLAAEVA